MSFKFFLRIFQSVIIEQIKSCVCEAKNVQVE